MKSSSRNHISTPDIEYFSDFKNVCMKLNLISGGCSKGEPTQLTGGIVLRLIII
jgi:hypothetical protein